MSGLITSLIPTVLGIIFGERERMRGQRELEPYQPQTTPLSQRMNRNTGTVRTGEGERVATPGGRLAEQYFQSRLTGAENRLAQERQLQHEFEGTRREYGKEFGTQQTALGGEIRGTRQREEEGLRDIAGAQQTANEYLMGAQREARQNLQSNLGQINQQVGSFMGQANQLMEQMMSMRGEALTVATDQSTKLLGSITTGIQSNMNSQIAEIEGRQDIPPGEREAMKERIRYLNGQQLFDTAASVMGQEAARVDNVRAQHDAMIEDLSGTIANASASIRGQAIGAATQAYATATSAQAQLADAGSRVSVALAETGTNFRANMGQIRANLQSTASAFAMSGRTDMANMVLMQPRAYEDLSPIMGEIFSTAMGMSQSDFNQELSIHNAMMAQYGLLQNVYYAPALMGMQAGLQTYVNANAPRPETGANAAEYISAAGNFMGGASQIVGGFKGQ